jgi:hypothetical protein
MGKGDEQEHAEGDREDEERCEQYGEHVIYVAG